MTHTIINQDPDKPYIQGESNLEKIKFMINNGMDKTYVNGKRITVLMDTRRDGERVTKVEVEGL